MGLVAFQRQVRMESVGGIYLERPERRFSRGRCVKIAPLTEIRYSDSVEQSVESCQDPTLNMKGSCV